MYDETLKDIYVDAQVFTKEHRKDKLPSKNFWSAYKKRTISHL